MRTLRIYATLGEVSLTFCVCVCVCVNISLYVCECAKKQEQADFPLLRSSQCVKCAFAMNAQNERAKATQASRGGKGQLNSIYGCLCA